MVISMFSITIPQKNIWNLQKFYSGSSIGNISGMLIFDAQLNLELLTEVINAFVKNQEGVRLQFAEDGGKITQYAVAYEPVNIPVLHFANMEEARSVLREEGKKPFVMTDSPMYRFYVFDTPEQCGICPCFHHLVSDAWTLGLFCSKVGEYYNGVSQ